MQQGDGPYLVLSDYGKNGWSVTPVGTFEAALKVRDEKLGSGPYDVVIAKRVKVEIKEVAE